nr:hypothetical protein [Tanacetum cinerariifolium]
MSSYNRYSERFTQLQSHHESGSGIGCGAGENDESEMMKTPTRMRIVRRCYIW